MNFIHIKSHGLSFSNDCILYSDQFVEIAMMSVPIMITYIPSIANIFDYFLLDTHERRSMKEKRNNPTMQICIQMNNFYCACVMCVQYPFADNILYFKPVQSGVPTHLYCVCVTILCECLLNIYRAYEHNLLTQSKRLSRQSVTNVITIRVIMHCIWRDFALVKCKY